MEKIKINRVLMLSIDGLRYDRLGFVRDWPNLTPNIDALAKTAINCTQTFSHGHPSQFAFPGIMSSTLNLSYGGYDKGIRDRPYSLAEMFQANDFKTIYVMSGPWQDSYFDYDRGVDQLHPVYDVKLFWYAMMAYFINYRKYRDQGLTTVKYFEDKMAELLSDCFDFIEERSEVMKQQKKVIPYGFFNLRHDFDHLIARVQAHRKELKADGPAYVRKYEDLIIQEDLFQLLGIKETDWKHRWLNHPWVVRSNKWLNKIGLRWIRDIGAVNGKYLRGEMIRLIKENKDKKFLLWTHFVDIHEYYVSPGHFHNTYGYPRIFWERFKRGKNYRSTLPYDISMNYSDKHIGKIVDALKKEGLYDDTLIVLFSDHGHPVGKPERAKTGVGYFYDELLQVPLIFSHPQLEGKNIDDLTGLMDLAPSLGDFLGFKNVEGFRGRSVLSKPPEFQYHLMEHTYRGPCDLSIKPVHLAIRTPEHKYIWREFLNPDDNLPERELYDLVNDPEERNNIYGQPEYKAIQQKLDAIIQERYQEIRSQNPLKSDAKPRS
jgi:hypothetical protein